MKNRVIGSYNSRLSIASRQVLIPSSSQVVFDFILGAFLLLALNARPIWLYFDQNLFSLRGISVGTFSDHSDVFARILAGVTNTRLPQVVFWVFVGAAVYVSVWLVRNILSNLHNDIAAAGYVHPQSYSNAKYWSSVLVRKAIFGMMGGLLLAYLYACLNVMPILAHYSYLAAMDVSSPHNDLVLAASLLAAAFAIHLLILLTSMVLNSWKFIYKDL